MEGRERIAELSLTYDEYMGIHSEWAGSKETVENLLRRITQETVYKILRLGYTRQPESNPTSLDELKVPPVELEISSYEIPHTAVDKHFTPPEPHEDRVEAVAVKLYWWAHPRNDWSIEIPPIKEIFRVKAHEILKLTGRIDKD